MHIPFVSTYLDTHSMYTVALQALVVLYGTALVASIFGAIGFTIFELLASGIVIITTAIAVSYVCAKALKVPAQHHSSLITALILILLLLPSLLPYDLFVQAVITAFAIVSKYVLVWRKQHVANPVAVGAVAGSLFGFGGAAWWIASPVFFIPILLLGLLVVLKVRRVEMVTVFLAVSFVGYLVMEWGSEVANGELLATFWLSYPFLFLAAFMLTEPFTMPGTRMQQIGYGAVIGVLVSVPTMGSFVMTPELALVIGNIVFFPYSVRQKLQLSFLGMAEVSPRIYEFRFKKPVGMQFVAGQYLEWMLPHRNPDMRGIRRYFTIASAPSDQELKVALKVPERASTYKQALLRLNESGQMIASQRAGDFVLPPDPAAKIGWIAGGIGVTPFVSQSRELLNTVETRDIVTLYATQTKDDVAYIDTLRQVSEVISVVGSGEALPDGEQGYVTKDMIARRVTDYRERTWYVSGPPGMVNAATKALRALGVPKSHIKEDFFPGLA